MSMDRGALAGWLGCAGGVVVLAGLVWLVIVLARRANRNNQKDQAYLRRIGFVPVVPGPPPPAWRPLLPDQGRGVLGTAHRGHWRGRPVLIGLYSYRADGLTRLARGPDPLAYWMTGIELSGRHPAREGGDWHLYDHQLLSYRLPIDVLGLRGKLTELDALSRVADTIEPAPPA